MTTDRPPCPKCQQAMQPCGMPVPEEHGSRWWKCACDRKTYLMKQDGWIVLRTGTE